MNNIFDHNPNFDYMFSLEEVEELVNRIRPHAICKLCNEIIIGDGDCKNNCYERLIRAISCISLP
jgi:hypothetical protein